MSAETETKPFGPPSILSQGYIVELAMGGPWLKYDLTWTPVWNERGVWSERGDAEFAIALSLERKIKP